jgi:tetratricopeptide (TPR) repeat protein
MTESEAEKDSEEIERYLEAQLAEVQALVGIGGQALRQGQIEASEEALSEAEAILDMAEVESLEHRKLKARVFNELGVLHQRRGDPGRSRDSHQVAADLCKEILKEDARFAINAAATHLNLSSVELASGSVESAMASCETALKLLEGASEEEKASGTYPTLLLGAHQNLAVISARADQWERANQAMEEALDAAEQIPVVNQASYVVQVAQGCQQLSVMLFSAKRHEEALRWGRKADELSAQGVEALGEPALPVYVISQLNLISYHEKLGNFADAEDGLWKALDVAGKDPRILLRGLTFYETCRKQADPRLEAGNLPRSEVDAGLEELMAQVEDAGGIDQIRAEVDRLQRSSPVAR